jgi:hypothetical protein
MVLPILAIAFRNFFIDSSGDVKAQQNNLLIPLHPRMTSSALQVQKYFLYLMFVFSLYDGRLASVKDVVRAYSIRNLRIPSRTTGE